MAEIKQYTRRIQPTATSRTRVNAGDIGGDQSGLRSLAGQVGNIGKILEEKQFKADKSDYYAKLTQLKLDNLGAAQELQNSEFADGVDFSAAYQQNLSERSDALEIPKSMEAQWQSDLGNMQLQFANQGINEQSRRAGVKAKTNWDNSVQSLVSMVELDPSSFDESIGLLSKQSESFPNMSPEDKDALLDRASDLLVKSKQIGSDKIRNNFIENNPQEVLNNPDNFSKKDIETARDLVLKSGEEMEKNLLADSITFNSQSHEKLFTGELTLADVEAISVKQGETPFVKMARKKLTKKTSKIKYTDLEKGIAFNELNVELLSIIKKVDGVSKINKDTLDLYSGFQQKVYGQLDAGLITEGEMKTFLNDYSTSINSAIIDNSTQGEGLVQSQAFGFGFNDPYGYGLKQIDTETTDISKKKDLIMLYSQYLGEYESKNSNAKDMEVMDAAMLAAKTQYAKGRYPSLNGYKGDIPNAALDGSVDRLVGGGNAADLANNKTERQFQDIPIPNDPAKYGEFAGKVKRVYKDGTSEVID